MGHDDREKKFEQALARHLRAGADAAEQAGAAPGAGDVGAKHAVDGSCPDAETLAAFHERMLSNEEMNGTKAHVAGCSRCQEILAHLEATDDVVMEEQEKVLTMREPVLSTGTKYEEHAAVSAAAPVTAARSSVAASTVQDISRGRGGRKWRWTAPAGAIAAGLLIWVVMQENRPLSFSKKANVQIAQQQSLDERTARQIPPSPPVAAPPEKGTELSSQPLSNERVRRQPAETRNGPRPAENKSAGAIGGMIAGKAGGVHGELRDSDALSAVKAGGKVARREGADKYAVAPENKNMPKSPAPSRTDSGGVAGNPGENLSASSESGRDVLSEEKSAPAAMASRAKPAAPPVSGAAEPAAKQDEEAARKKEADESANSVTSTAQQIEVTAAPARISALQKDKAAEAKIIASPGGAVSWRLGAKGSVERSEDGGATWSRQKSGYKAELLAGSAPSEAVCWIVGRKGTILRTTDGGGHWSKVVAPVTGDILRVVAEDGMHAVIFGTGNEGKFVTSDGGVTWGAVLK